MTSIGLQLHCSVLSQCIAINYFMSQLVPKPCRTGCCKDCNLCIVTGQQPPLESYPSLDYPTYDPNYRKQSRSQKALPQGVLSPSIHIHTSRHHHAANSSLGQEQKHSHLVPVGVGSHGWRTHTRKFILVRSLFCFCSDAAHAHTVLHCLLHTVK